MFDIVLIFTQNIDSGYTLEPLHLDGSNEYLQFRFLSKDEGKKIWKKICAFVFA